MSLQFLIFSSLFFSIQAVAQPVDLPNVTPSDVPPQAKSEVSNESTKPAQERWVEKWTEQRFSRAQKNAKDLLAWRTEEYGPWVEKKLESLNGPTSDDLEFLSRLRIQFYSSPRIMTILNALLEVGLHDYPDSEKRLRKRYFSETEQVNLARALLPEEILKKDAAFRDSVDKFIKCKKSASVNQGCDHFDFIAKTYQDACISLMAMKAKDLHFPLCRLRALTSEDEVSHTQKCSPSALRNFIGDYFEALGETKLLTPPKDSCADQLDALRASTINIDSARTWATMILCPNSELDIELGAKFRQRQVASSREASKVDSLKAADEIHALLKQMQDRPGWLGRQALRINELADGAANCLSYEVAVHEYSQRVRKSFEDRCEQCEKGIQAGRDILGVIAEKNVLNQIEALKTDLSSRTDAVHNSHLQEVINGINQEIINYLGATLLNNYLWSVFAIDPATLDPESRRQLEKVSEAYRAAQSTSDHTVPQEIEKLAKSLVAEELSRRLAKKFTDTRFDLAVKRASLTVSEPYSVRIKLDKIGWQTNESGTWVPLIQWSGSIKAGEQTPTQFRQEWTPEGL